MADNQISHPKVEKVCETCGSTDVVKDAWVSWDFQKQEYTIEDIFPQEFCKQCDGECTIIDKTVIE